MADWWREMKNTLFLALRYRYPGRLPSLPVPCASAVFCSLCSVVVRENLARGERNEDVSVGCSFMSLAISESVFFFPVVGKYVRFTQRETMVMGKEVPSLSTWPFFSCPCPSVGDPSERTATGTSGKSMTPEGAANRRSPFFFLLLLLFSLGSVDLRGVGVGVGVGLLGVCRGSCGDCAARRAGGGCSAPILWVCITATSFSPSLHISVGNAAGCSRISVGSSVEGNGTCRDLRSRRWRCVGLCFAQTLVPQVPRRRVSSI